MRGRWWRPKPKETLRDSYMRRWAARFPLPNPADQCAAGCRPDMLYRVVAGPALAGSLICRACGSVYRKE